VNDPPAQRLLEVPVITPGWAVSEETTRVFATLEPQLFPALTDRLPDANPAGKVTETVLLPWPLLITAPAGTVQV
jgi:hypothetical protein